MQTLCHQIDAPAEWAVFHAMSGVLRSSCVVHQPEQKVGSRDARSDKPSRWEPWPGFDLGVRGPVFGETPLSAAEVPYLFRGVAGEGVSL